MDYVVSDERPERRSSPVLMAVWLATTALLLVLLQTINIPSALGDEGVAPVEGPGADYAVGGIDLTDIASPSAVYGGTVWSITDTRIDPAGGQLLGRARIEVDAVVTNGLAMAQVRVPEGMVTLEADGRGVVGDAKFVDSGSRLSIEPGEQRVVTIAFDVGYSQDPSVDELSLIIGEASRIPAVIRLGATDNLVDAPIQAAVSNDLLRVPDPDAPTRSLVVEPQGASVGINAGPYRAATGERLAVVKVLVQRAEAIENPGFADYGFWALDADGEQLDPVLVAVASQSASNIDEVTLVFTYPDDVDDLAVTVSPDDDPTTFAVVIPRSR